MQIPVSVGEHIRAVRLARNLYQVDAAKLFGVDTATVANWEKGKTLPPTVSMGAVISFLGFDPYKVEDSAASRMRGYRRKHGLSVKVAATRLGIDEGTWSKWEQGGAIAWKRYKAKLESFLNAHI